jgi:dTDP-4-dehydrorhamnose 3,5-epimerase
MKIQEKIFQDCAILKLEKFHDSRGYFYEAFNMSSFSELVCETRFVQDNVSISKKDVFRGIHLQKNPCPQGKFIQVLAGTLLDFIVDLRKNSKTFLEYKIIELSENDSNAIWIPPGFGHGFLAREDNTILSYKVDNWYSRDSEICLRYDDEQINIKELKNYNNLLLSEKDLNGSRLVDINLNELF